MHASLADVLTDLVQNSVEAGAVNIGIIFDEGFDVIRFLVKDDGKGMDKGTLERAEDPFWTDGIKHPGRRVGLGIPFLRQMAEITGGRIEIDSTPGKGTAVDAEFPADHLDLPPVGDLALLWTQCLTFSGDYNMNIRRLRRDSSGRERLYEVNRAEVSEVLGGLEDAGALGLLREYISSLEESLTEER
jgi:hypothetical protein